MLFAEIAAPPMNLLGPELVRDLVSLIQPPRPTTRSRSSCSTSGDPDYFISHVDLTRVAAYRAEAAVLTGEASIASLFRYLSASRLVTIAQIEGRVRGAGSEFVLACDMRFAARETAIFAQFESAFGQIPGGGAAQYLTRLMGRARALEVLLSADDYDADLAERYGWINRALPAGELASFVRCARPPDRVDSRQPARPPSRIGSTRSPSRQPRTSAATPISSREQVGSPETQRLIQAAMQRGLADPRRGAGARTHRSQSTRPTSTPTRHGRRQMSSDAEPHGPDRPRARRQLRNRPGDGPPRSRRGRET